MAIATPTVKDCAVEISSDDASGEASPPRCKSSRIRANARVFRDEPTRPSTTRRRGKEPAQPESPTTVLIEMKGFIATQTGLNEAFLESMRAEKAPKTGSPIIDSNSPHGLGSRTKGRSSVARTSLRFPPPTKTYARRGKKLKQPKGAEPEFNPVANAISSSDNGTFRFTRTKARTRGVVGGDRGSGS
ncbi:hypothetical protein PIB30_028970 [Stylosanthes scabra]|uniref:Uncharacterized protein n=1 Tax=Stylosanthes scabra TaxID=79078 RepID=A0ABU6VA16_9FABA|nr:hypothetical protein [Stylosanthes scabra]